MTERTPFDLRPYVRDVADFPKPGVMFRDITPLLSNAGLFHTTIYEMYKRMISMNLDICTLAAPESRGFILAAALAQRAECGFVPMRKPGKLPFTTLKCDYGLEYRDSDQLQMHTDAVQPGQTVLVVDDVLATGGTAVAACELLSQAGVKCAGVLVLVELMDLGGRKKIESAGYRVESLLQY